MNKASSKFEIVKEYDNGIDSLCTINSINEGYNEIQQNRNRNCEIEFIFPDNVEITETVYLYYELENFYQNHRRYVVSKSDDQLTDSLSFNSDSEEYSDELTDCTPDSTLFRTIGDVSYIEYPCGLIAQSYFNDGIQLKSYIREDSFNITWVNTIPLTTNSQDENSDSFEPILSLNKNEISLKYDSENMFMNPTIEDNYPHYETFEYLWQTYDQFSCYNITNPYQRLECVNWNDFVRTSNSLQTDLDENIQISGQGCAQLCIDEDDAIIVNEGGILPPDSFITPLSQYGLRDENFIVWMRTAAFSTFRKLYAKIDITVENELTLDDSFNLDDIAFKKGDKLQIKIVPNFLVADFGKKKLILSTYSPLTSNYYGLGIAYLSFGIVGIVVGICVTIKMKFKPRKLGDPSYLLQANQLQE